MAVGEILGALEIGTHEDAAESFLAAWHQHPTEDDRPAPLPAGWRSHVQALVDLGLPADLIEVCATVGATNYDVRPTKRFAYAIATGRRTAELHRKAAALSAAHRDEGMPARDLVVNVQGGIVHTPVCAALDVTGVLNLMSVTHVAPFRACQKCRP